MGPLERIGRGFLQGHQVIYEKSGGLIGHRALGVPSLLLRTTGARTGKTRTNALAYGRDGGGYLVVASNGGSDRAPGWLHNIRANQEVDVQVGRRHMPSTARVVAPGDPDYERLWDIANRIPFNRNRYRGYQKKTERPIPVVVATPR